MPLIFWVGGSIFAGLTGLLGFGLGGGFSGLGNILKYGVIGGVGYFAYKELRKAKVI